MLFPEVVIANNSEFRAPIDLQLLSHVQLDAAGNLFGCAVIRPVPTGSERWELFANRQVLDLPTSVGAHEVACGYVAFELNDDQEEYFLSLYEDRPVRAVQCQIEILRPGSELDPEVAFWMLVFPLEAYCEFHFGSG